jgi:hypothetical protein
MAEKKYQKNYINVYMPQEVQEQAQRVAELLHSKGVPGILDEDGDMRVSALFRYLLKLAESEFTKDS